MNSDWNFDWFAEKNAKYNGINKAGLKSQEIPKKEALKLTKEIDNKTKFFYAQQKLVSSLYFEKKIVDGTPAEKFKTPKVHDLDTDGSFSSLINKPEPENFNSLPLYSLLLQFTFSLETPYISKDDEAFYWPENPVKKDKVLKLPMISGSTWKGNLRWAAGKLLEVESDDTQKAKKRLQIIKLFGSEHAAEKAYFDRIIPEDVWKEYEEKLGTSDARKGRLNFYPTFFKQISLEVINPHDRKTKAGTIPVYIESVPADADGIFSLLYMPFDLMGRSNEDIRKEAKDDFDFIVEAMSKLMLEYGICAKKSSGFGIVKNEFIDKSDNSYGYLYLKNKEKQPFKNFTEMRQANEVFKSDE